MYDAVTGQPHPEDQAGDEHEDQRENEVAAGKGDHHRGKLEPEPGQPDDADDDAGDGAGHGHGNRVACPQDQRLSKQCEPRAYRGRDAAGGGRVAVAGFEHENLDAAAQERHRHHRQDRPESDAHGRQVLHQQEDQQEERQDELPPGLERVDDARQLVGGMPFMPAFIATMCTKR